jgi:stage V sporulation protein S
MDLTDETASTGSITTDLPPEERDEATEILKVSAHSRPSAVAGAIAAVIRNHGRADVQAIGAGATNQAVKAVAIARDYLQPNGIDIVVVPAFIDVTIANEERTAIRLVVEARS